MVSLLGLVIFGGGVGWGGGKREPEVTEGSGLASLFLSPSRAPDRNASLKRWAQERTLSFTQLTHEESGG